MGLWALVSAARISRTALPQPEARSFRATRWGKVAPIHEVRALDGQVGRFVDEVLGAESVAERVELVATKLSDIDLETWGIRARVGMWARVSLFSGGALSVACLCEALTAAQTAKAVLAILPFAVGSIGAIGCYWMGRLAGDAAELRRRTWDALSAALIQPLMHEQSSVMPGTEGSLSAHK